MPYISATIEINNGIRAVTHIDFCKYYQWFIKREVPWVKTQLPSYGAHCSIVLPKIHKVVDFSPVIAYDGIVVNIDYSIDIIQSPRNFWLPCSCKEAIEILSILNLPFSGLHLTICNTKFNYDKS